jgi:hypothetical protein
VAAAALLALPGCPPADPGVGDAAPSAPAASAPPADEAAAPVDAAVAADGDAAAAGDVAPPAEGEAAEGEAAEGEAAEGEAAEGEAAPGTTPAEGQPAPDTAAADDEKIVPGVHDEFVDSVFSAFKKGDYDVIAASRKKLTARIVDEMMGHYHAGLSGDVKDGFTHLMVNRSETAVALLMKDSLGSKRLESKAQAVATLSKDKGMLATLKDAAGKYDEAKVDAAIAAYRVDNP